MNGIIITLKKDELVNLVQNAIEGALTSLGLQKEIIQDDNMTVEEVAKWLRWRKPRYIKKHITKQFFLENEENAFISHGKN